LQQFFSWRLVAEAVGDLASVLAVLSIAQNMRPHLEDQMPELAQAPRQ